MISSEAVPFAKTGGLADVVTGLSRALDRAGHEVALILPYHRRFTPPELAGEPTGRAVQVMLGRQAVQGWVRRSQLPDSRIAVYLIDHPGYFDRSGLYVDGGADYPDNAERFIFLSRAALEVCDAFQLRPDILHVHDWQTALVAPLLSVLYRRRNGFQATRSVLTLHNLAFQGNFPRAVLELTGLPAELFTWDKLEFWGNLNFLKGGCVYADRLTTVSPTYAREITTPAFGWGLEGVLRHRGAALTGILNGVDTEHWDPARDPYLPQPYTLQTVEAGKARAKEVLQRELGLAPDPRLPLCGLVSRLTDQKGLDLIAATADQWLAAPAQFVFLGNGERRYETLLTDLARRAPDRVAAVIGYSEPRAHLIEGGADIFLMPSRFEPCGLNQMYSLLYGTIPLVHAVGGLADSVTNLTPETLAQNSATGFVFYDYTADAFLGTLRWGLATYQNRDVWRALQRNGMTQDLSWARSAERYLEVYRAALASG